MAKRKKTATVQLKLRIREELRRKLEREAKGRKASLNSEMARRLESSFESGTTEKLVQLLTGSPEPLSFSLSSGGQCSCRKII